MLLFIFVALAIFVYEQDVTCKPLNRNRPRIQACLWRRRWISSAADDCTCICCRWQDE